FNTNSLPLHYDLALLKLDSPALGLPFNSILPLCNKKAQVGNILGACGLGAVSNFVGYKLPDTLKETFFQESDFWHATPTKNEPCPVDYICTTPLFDGGSICNLDDGGPLFLSECGLDLIKCVYGVAGFFKSMRGSTGFYHCSHGSYFADVTYHYKWLTTTMRQN
ncbi:uncharacterized protein LOC142355346, partial [Convolutriloba macropyga]|uniref:uncharacterized protein LOC142355346 n=1 Tax=Convolutriloba macropyga TaxID=536237 RepID=UPI003F5241D0